ncbi:MAG TPA: sigma-70 family RNA polymerase sigma factor [Pirellulaceae bacterium]|nr:sigma-70 family RNA polymerase sigma factor [Pirellulaceae bacterium]
MSQGPRSSDHSKPGSAQFATTAWSLIAAAGSRESPQAQAALAELCQRYWYPLYAFLRRSGQNPDQASDSIQGFFAELLERSRLRVADPQRGRFRSFLLASLKNYCANQRRREQALKRGGERLTFSIDCTAGEERYGIEPQNTLTPERLFERKWALQLLERCLQRLEQEAVERGRHKIFGAVKPFLSGLDADVSYQQIADEHATTPSAVKVAVHRWRNRLRELIRSEIAETVTTSEELNQEIEQLFSALSDE